ncbi:MAG: hypothetical protein QGI75_00835 [Phycisphaerales bacterium]|jgi:hypothetical protein|nr:hypothetical protein [Phycisphaerales bacterium]MDP6891443.1 hypothetical protein [Phycisphaerales bacterium]
MRRQSELQCVSEQRGFAAIAAEQQEHRPGKMVRAPLLCVWGRIPFQWGGVSGAGGCA